MIGELHKVDQKGIALQPAQKPVPPEESRRLERWSRSFRRAFNPSLTRPSLPRPMLVSSPSM